MTVGELKEKLKNVDDNYEVIFSVGVVGDTYNYVLINYTEVTDGDFYFVLKN